MASRGRLDGGFTLVEMAVVLALLAALVTLAFGAVRHYGGVLASLHGAAGRFDQARHFAALREALHGTRRWLEPVAAGRSPGRNGGYRPYFEGEARRLAFYTTAPLLHRPDGEPFQLEIAADEGGARLRERPAYRRDRDYRSTAPWAGEGWSPLPEEWTLRRIEYHDRGRWVERIDGRVPSAVRLWVAIDDEEEGWFFTVRADDDQPWREALGGDGTGR